MKIVISNRYQYFFGAYALASLVIARLANSYSMIVAMAVAPNLLLVPYLLGAGILGIFNRKLDRESKSFAFLIALFVGAIFLHAFFVLAEFFWLKINMLIFNMVIIIIIVVGFSIDLIRQKDAPQGVVHNKEVSPKETDIDVSMVVSLVFVFLIAILAFYVPKISVPFPLVSYDGGVGHEFLKPVNRLLNDGVLDVYRTRSLPVVFGAIISSLSNVPVLNLSWAAPLSVCLVFSFSMFSLTYGVTKKKIVALASVLLVFFINSNGLFFDTTYFIFRYSTILAAVSPLVLWEVLHFFETRGQRPNVTKHIIFFFTLALFLATTLFIFEFFKPHFFVAFFEVNEFFRPFLYIAFLVIAFFYKRKMESQEIKGFLLISLFTVFAITLDIFRSIIFVLFLYFFLLLLDKAGLGKENGILRIVLKKDTCKYADLRVTWYRKINILRSIAFLAVFWLIVLMMGYLNLKEFAPFYQVNLDTSTKVWSLTISNSVEIVMFSLFLSIVLLFSSHIGEFVLAFSFIAGMFLYFIPIFELWYIILFLNVPMAFTISVGVSKMLMPLDRYMLSLKNRISKRFKVLMKFSVGALVYLLLIFAIFVPIFNSSITRFTWVTEGAKNASLLSDSELKLVKDYLYNIDKDVRIISDPFTMIYFSSYINNVALLEEPMPPLGNQSRDVVFKIWQDIFHGKTSLNIYSSIMSFKDVIPHVETRYLNRIQSNLNFSRYIVIVSARTAWWLDKNDPFGYYTLFPHSYNVTTAHIIRFLDPLYFNLIYKIDSKMYVFSVEKTGNVSSNYFETNYLFKEPQTDFWKVVYYGKGNYNVTMSQLSYTTDSDQSNNYLNITTSSGDYKVWMINHDFTNYIDFSKYDLIILPFYGQSTNRTFYFSLDGPTIYDRTIFLFRDDFEGWGSIMFSLNSPTTTENSPDFTKIIRITFSPFTEDNYSLGELYLGPIKLLKVHL